jgi:hypothetical protein
MSGAVGALSGATDATATMLEIINEELQTQGMTLSKDSLQDIFEDQELMEKMRSKALARGVSIAVVDALTMGVAGRVVGALGTGVKGTLAGGGVEMLGGGVGEAAAQIASGEPLNQGEILLEAAAEGPMVMTSLITSKQPKYTIAGQKVRKSDVEAYLRSGEDLSKVSIENDEKLSTELQDQKEKSGILANIPEDMVEADRQRAMELERERGQKAGSKLEVNKKRVSDIDTELQDIYRRYFDEGERAQPQDPQKRTRVRNADEILNNLANVGKVRVKTMRGLYDVNRMMFGLDEEQALANTIIMDRMIGQMAQRAGVEKQAMYGEIGFAKGDEATAQGLRENGAALFQNDFSDVESGITYRYDKNTEEWSALEEDGTITRNKTLADFEGEPMLVHGPDVAFSGSIMVGEDEVVKGQGGMYYPIKYLNDGVFWASKGVGPTNQAIASINKSGRTSSTGNGYMVLMTGGDEKILNSFTGFGSVVNIMNHLHTKGLYGLSQARFQRAIKQAYNAKVRKDNKMVRVFDKGVTAAVGSPQEMVETLLEDTRDLSFAARAAILDTFFDSIASSLNGSTVENRVAFKKFLAGDNPAFKESRLRGKVKMGKAELFDGFSYMIGEPFLRDMKRGEKGSYAYAVLEAVRPEGMNRNADLVEYSGESKHESYPSVIKLKEGVKFRLHALSDHSSRYDDSFKHPQTGTMKTPEGANVFGGQIQMGVDVMKVTGMKPKETEATEEALFQGDRGAMVREDSKAVIYSLTSPDVSTPLHEMAHVFEHYLTDAERKQVMEWAGTKEWNRDTSEAFAEGFEAWLAEGGPQESKLFNVYDSFKKWMLDIYEGITGTPMERKLNDPMRAIYAEMTGEAQAQRQQQEAGQPKKMRRFSQRVAQNVEELREDIINNPESYYEPMVYAEIRERLAKMSHEELVTEMKLSGLTNLSASGGQIGVMAGIERMNRALAEGDFNTVDAVQEELAKIGTAAGQILRQFGELRTSTPANLVSFIEQQMNKRGNEMTDSQRKVLEGIAQDFLRSQARYKDLIAQITFNDGMTEAEFNALEKEIQSEQEKIASAEKELDTFTNAYVERGFSDLATMMVQGNLLTPMSQITNIFANAVNVATVIPRDIIATMLEGPFRRIASAFGKELQPSNRTYSIAAYMHGVRMFGKGVIEAGEQVITGRSPQDVEWRLQRGFAPWRSLLALADPRNPIATRAKQMGVDVDTALPFSQKLKLAFQGSFGVPAEIMFRLLSLGDTPFRRFMEGVETYQAAKQAGVHKNKDKLRQYLKYPPKKVLQEATEEGLRLTFQQETGFSRRALGAIDSIVKGAENYGGQNFGGAVKFALRTQLPYVKTPANILSETLEYVFTPLAATNAIIKARKGDMRGSAQSFAKGAIGVMVATAAREMIAQGLMSGEPEWGGDEAEKNLAYDQFPPSSINITALNRYMGGGDPSVQPRDVFYSYKKFGLIGVMMGAQTKIPQDANQGSAFKQTLGNIFGIQAFANVNYLMDQSFLQGANNLINLFSATEINDIERAVEKWLTSTMQAVSAVGVPNTLSAIHRAEREYLPDVRVSRGQTLGDRLYDRLRFTVLDRTFNMSDVPVRINWKGLPIQQTPEGASAWQYNLFDVTKARQGEADPVSNEIYRLYEVTDEVSNVVSTPSFARNQTMTVPKLDRKVRNQLRTAGLRVTFADDRDFYQDRIALSTEQLNQLMQVAGQQRYADVQELIGSSKYARMSDEERLSTLDKVAGKYNQRIEYVRPGRLADHSVLLMSFIQQLYDGRQEEVQGDGGR